MFPLYVLLSQTPNSKYYFVMSLTDCCTMRKLAGRAALLVLLTLSLSRLPVVFQLSTLEFPPAKAQTSKSLIKIAYPYIYIYILYIPLFNNQNPTPTPYLFFIHYRTYLACPVKRVSLDLFRFKIQVFFSIQQ